MPWPWAIGRQRTVIGATLLGLGTLLLLITLSAASGPTATPSATDALALPATGARVTATPPAVGSTVPSPTAGPIRVPPRLQVVADRGSVRISGVVGSRQAETEIRQKVVAVYGAASVDVSLDVDPGVADVGAAKVANVVTALGQDASGVTLDLADNRLALQGYVANETVHAEVSVAAAAVTSDESAVDDGIRVVATTTPTPVETDDTLEPITPVVPETTTATAAP